MGEPKTRDSIGNKIKVGDYVRLRSGYIRGATILHIHNPQNDRGDMTVTMELTSHDVTLAKGN